MAANFFQEDEIPFSMSTVACRRALEAGAARCMSTLVFCRLPLSAGTAVSFAVKAAIQLRPLDAEPKRHGDAQDESADAEVPYRSTKSDAYQQIRLMIAGPTNAAQASTWGPRGVFCATYMATRSASSGAGIDPLCTCMFPLLQL